MAEMKKRNEEIKDAQPEIVEELIRVNRIVKVTKGGRKFRFSALVAIGNNKGGVGLGYGKAREVPDAVKKATNSAQKDMVHVYVKKNTIPHEVIGRYASTTILLKPARPGTGIIAGGVARSIIAKAGISDLLSKVHGSKNPLNVAKATINALQNLENPLDVAKRRGKKVSEIFQ